MGYITQNYQKDVLQAIFKEANELGYTVFCFANFGAYGDKVLYAEGERGIMYLPDLTQLDGIIVGEDTFDVPGMGNEIYVYLKKNADCPVVYLRTAREGFYRVVMDEGEAIRNMTRHFTQIHGFRDVCFMTGAFDRLDARNRYQGYLDVMHEEGIEVTDHMVFFGDYWREKGKEARISNSFQKSDLWISGVGGQRIGVADFLCTGVYDGTGTCHGKQCRTEGDCRPRTVPESVPQGFPDGTL